MHLTIEYHTHRNLISPSIDPSTIANTATHQKKVTSTARQMEGAFSQSKHSCYACHYK